MRSSKMPVKIKRYHVLSVAIVLFAVIAAIYIFVTQASPPPQPSPQLQGQAEADRVKALIGSQLGNALAQAQGKLANAPRNVPEQVLNAIKINASGMREKAVESGNRILFSMSIVNGSDWHIRSVDVAFLSNEARDSEQPRYRFTCTDTISPGSECVVERVIRKEDAILTPVVLSAMGVPNPDGAVSVAKVE